MEDLIDAQADFALSLLRKIVAAKNEDESVVYSPTSVALVLAMVYAGAEAETADELASALGGRNASRAAIHNHFAALLQSVGAPNTNYTLDAANRAYISKEFKILDAYKEIVKKFYGGQFELVDFLETAKTVKLINDFVAQKTHDKIQNLLSPDVVDGNTRMILLNAIYFKGAWANKFDATDTKTETFFVRENCEKEVEMMSKYDRKARYFENSILKRLALPYAGEEIFAHFILPKERFGLAKVLERLDAGMFSEVVGTSRQEQVDIKLPKFRVESTHDLPEILKSLGVTKIFSSEANLKGMSSDPLIVSAIVQKAFIKTDEEGSEAAAATFAVVMKCAMPSTFDFHADEPFLFFLADTRKNILFGGVIRGD